MMYSGTELSPQEVESGLMFSRPNRGNYVCGECGKSYSRSHNLRRHQNLECQRLKKYSCSESSFRIFGVSKRMNCMKIRCSINFKLLRMILKRSAKDANENFHLLIPCEDI
ncbi:uncharacterized protein LOC117167765 [Belonocnema kinseyi]|uniref:uncharacterized protein LOC117167765 n=1 Tax=Belonocnema kinseyi TaxID=2817044 RepID=UPI00143E05D4|nr:uncharacterized protein LOC117167765 [Belonocnema kinseyi]